MPAERMAATIQQLRGQPMTSQHDYVRLMHEAGFKRVALFFNALGGMLAWIAASIVQRLLVVAPGAPRRQTSAVTRTVIHAADHRHDRFIAWTALTPSALDAGGTRSSEDCICRSWNQATAKSKVLSGHRALVRMVLDQ